MVRGVGVLVALLLLLPALPVGAHGANLHLPTHVAVEKGVELTLAADSWAAVALRVPAAALHESATKVQGQPVVTSYGTSVVFLKSAGSEGIFSIQIYLVEDGGVHPLGGHVLLAERDAWGLNGWRFEGERRDVLVLVVLATDSDAPQDVVLATGGMPEENVAIRNAIVGTGPLLSLHDTERFGTLISRGVSTHDAGNAHRVVVDHALNRAGVSHLGVRIAGEGLGTWDLARHVDDASFYTSGVYEGRQGGKTGFGMPHGTWFDADGPVKSRMGAAYAWRETVPGRHAFMIEAVSVPFNLHSYGLQWESRHPESLLPHSTFGCAVFAPETLDDPAACASR